MTVSELIAELKQYPPDLVVKVASDDGNADCHVDPSFSRLKSYKLSVSTYHGWAYEKIDVPILEIS